MKIKKKLLLSALLLAAVFALNTGQGAFAATTASQTVIGTLGFSRSIVANGGNLASNITDIGNLQTPFAPNFTIKCNSTAAQTLTFNGLSTTSDGTTQSFFAIGSTPYIVLTNQTVKPSTIQADDCKAATPTEANNPNAIAYPVNALPSTPDVGKLSWAAFSTDHWTGTLTNKGNIDSAITVPAGAARPLTFSGDDEAGSYQAVVTLSFT